MDMPAEGSAQYGAALLYLDVFSKLASRLAASERMDYG